MNASGTIPLTRKRAPRRHHIALTKQCDNNGRFKCWRIDCGSVLQNGARKRKAFYLGKDEYHAEKLSIRIRDRWNAIEASAFDTPPVWGVADLAEIQLWINNQEVALDPTARDTLLAHDAMDIFVEHERVRLEARQISWGRWRTLRDTFKWVKKYLLPNIPMRAIDHGWLNKISLLIKTPARSQKTGKMLSSRSAVIRLDTVKCFLQWANKLDYWDAPKLFYSDRGLWRMSAPEKRRFDGGRDRMREKPISLSMDDLKLIWRYVRDPKPRIGYTLKAMFLLGLNAAFSHSEFAKLRYETGKEEEDAGAWRVHVEAESWSVKGPRPKTGIWCEGINLWPETVAAIKLARAEDNDDALCFLNPWGRPIYVSHERAEPCTSRWWKRLRNEIKKDTGIIIRSFKYFRKTAAQLVRDISGNRSLADMLLCHAESEMSRAYHADDYKRLNEALEEVRRRLFAELEQPQTNEAGSNK